MKMLNEYLSTVKETAWPESLPVDGEKCFLSISCGNSFLHWAFHGDGELAPALFWRTPTLITEDFDCDDAEALSRHFPEIVFNHVFGSSSSPTVEAANLAAASRTPLSVYLVSSNRDQIGMLSKLLGCIPSRIFRMKGEDFFTSKEGRYPTMGVDRLATLRGAEHLYGFPSLVFDGGTAITYTASDRNGYILGGGISPGLLQRLNSMHESTDALPKISMEDIGDMIEKAVKQTKPLKIFSSNTQDAMCVSVLSELASNAREVIKLWLEKVDNGRKNNNKQKQNKERKVLVTGGSGDVIMQLLKEKCGNIIEVSTEDVRKKYNVVQAKNLIHYGITAALMKHKINNHGKNSVSNLGKRVGKTAAKNIPKTDAAVLSNKRRFAISYGENPVIPIGIRVAKNFRIMDEDGDTVFRGTIKKRDELKGNKVYLVEYDDGDSEQVEPDEINVGEKRKKSTKQKKEEGKACTGKKEKQMKITRRAESTTKDIKKIEVTRKSKKDETEISSESKISSSAVSPASKKHSISVQSNPNKRSRNENSNPLCHIKSRVAKDFAGSVFFGTIVSYSSGYWRVEYDDGDEEDYDSGDIITSSKLYSKSKHDDPNAVSGTQINESNNLDSKSNGKLANTQEPAPLSSTSDGSSLTGDSDSIESESSETSSDKRSGNKNNRLSNTTCVL